MNATTGRTIIQKHLGKLLVLQEHLYQVFQLQALGNHDDPEVSSLFSAYASLAKSDKEALARRLEELGVSGNVGQVAKEGIATTLGIAAGLVDKFRSEEVSKNLRDDYAALNFQLITCLIVHTTAVALGDHSTAQLVASQAKATAHFIVELQQIIPGLVLRDLQHNHSVQPCRAAVEETRQLLTGVWQAAKGRLPW